MLTFYRNIDQPLMLSQYDNKATGRIMADISKIRKNNTKFGPDRLNSERVTVVQS